MIFSDIFKNSFLENISSFSPLDMLIAFALAFVTGLFLMWVYRRTFRGVLYSQSFAVSLLAMTLITTLIILAISSNIILSLGMVGALSIVRFRSAIKEPIDIAFLFWAISAGIVFGAGLIPLGLLGSLFIGIVLLLFVNRQSHDNPYILILNCDHEQAEQAACEVLKASVKRYLLKAKTVSESGLELTVEVRIKDSATDFVNALNSIPGVRIAALVSYNGDYMG